MVELRTCLVPRGCPSSAPTAKRDLQGIRGMLNCHTKFSSIKFPAAPESNRALVTIVLVKKIILTGTSIEFNRGGILGKEGCTRPSSALLWRSGWTACF